ncbi:hypothetical protein SAMN02745823_00774 [Sporobacter termitidis DSM 10068]|uniref:Uncharacterized protein n=1 Tax=Sporobacter termitidis DSM 10068 TaxID=1123282 RepID=A0A1M5VDG0_9FIRM|nr:hypothetical protein SAMN02745823_00774 [Sporobacter termitidis DSM 10068]
MVSASYLAGFAFLLPLLEIGLMVCGIIALIYAIKALQIYIKKNRF